MPRVCVCGSEISYRGHVAESGGVNFYPVKIYSVYFLFFFFYFIFPRDALKKREKSGQYIGPAKNMLRAS